MGPGASHGSISLPMLITSTFRRRNLNYRQNLAPLLSVKQATSIRLEAEGDNVPEQTLVNLIYKNTMYDALVYYDNYVMVAALNTSSLKLKSRKKSWKYFRYSFLKLILIAFEMSFEKLQCPIILCTFYIREPFFSPSFVSSWKKYHDSVWAKNCSLHLSVHKTNGHCNK